MKLSRKARFWHNFAKIGIVAQLASGIVYLILAVNCLVPIISIQLFIGGYLFIFAVLYVIGEISFAKGGGEAWEYEWRLSI